MKLLLTLPDDFSDGLILNVANNCSNTIVVIHNAGVRLVDQWIEHPNVTAVIFAHLPGQDSGRAITQLLYGVQSPSGKLPYTVAKNESDYNAAIPKASFNCFHRATSLKVYILITVILTRKTSLLGTNLDSD
jgi:beta-glucosidase